MKTGVHRFALVVCLLLAVAFALGGAHAPSAHADPADQPQLTVLPGGLSVVANQHADADTVSIAVSVRAGSRDEAPSFRGGAHWLEHLHFLGSQRYPSQAAIFSAIAGVGGSIDATTGNETTSFYVTVPASAFTTALDVMSDIMINPLFPPAAAEQEKSVVIDEITGESSPLTSAAYQALGEQLVGTVVHDPGATPQSVTALKLDDALAFSAQHYVASNMAVGVVGPLPTDYVTAAVASAFAGLPTGQPTMRTLPLAQDSLRLQAGSSSLVFVGQRIPGVTSPDAAALNVLDAILDVPGTRIADAIEAGTTTYGGGTYIVQYSDAGLWTAYGHGDPREVLSIVQQQLRLLQSTPVPADELNAATSYLAGRVLINNERSSAQAIRLALSGLYGTPATAQQWADQILAVTSADVQRVAQTYFNP
ncbi:MAG TPA: pitrilysin family protein, partial [Dehalococcoidia bacterium]|nr:pitrilysin family protein [Dehalococcoidia bacterium]